MNVFKVGGVYFLNCLLWYYRKNLHGFELFSDFFLGSRYENHNECTVHQDGKVNGII